MADDTISFSIRMPKTLRDEIDAAAAAEGTSTAKQIIRFIEAGLRKSDGDGRGLGGLARKVAEAEKITGKNWLEDVRTFGAVQALVEKWLFESRPRPKNWEAISAASAKTQEAENKLSSTLAALEEAGVISKRPTTTGGLASIRANAPRKSGGLFGQMGMLGDLNHLTSKLSQTLYLYGYVLNVDENDEAVSWTLSNTDGTEMSEDDKLGYKALLAMTIPWHERVVRERSVFLAAWAEDDAEIKAGADLVKPIPSSGE